MLSSYAIHHLLAKLNGFQRLWALASGLWLFGVVAIVWDKFPTEDRWRAEATALAAANRDDYASKAKETMTACANKIFAENSSPCTEYDMHTYRNFKEMGQNHYRWQQEFGERRIQDELRNEQLKQVGFSLGLWLLPSFSLYFLGSAIAWVARGFRRDA